MKKTNILSECISIIDDFSIDDLNQLKKIKVSIVMKSFVESNSDNDVAQELRESELNN